MSLRIPAAALIAALGLALAASSASAQIALPGGLPAAPRLPAGDLPSRLPIDPSGLQDRLGADVARGLRAPARLRDLIRRSGGALEADPDGWPVVSGRIVAVDLSPEARRAALAAGFDVVSEERLEGLDLVTTVLAPPRGLSLRRAIERLRRQDPRGGYDFNHVHTPAGVAAGPAVPPPSGPAPVRSTAPPTGLRLGLIDTGVETGHPALAGAEVHRRGFAGPYVAAAHGTAVGSLLVGRSGAFSGAAPDAELWSADVYGGSRAGGASIGVAQALAWMVGAEVPVVNISLVGPRDALVETAVRRAEARGLLIVAAVGNDGPAAPPLYPASYPGVVGVTGVNRRGQALPEAARGPQVDFAAPGADMAAAGPGEGYVSVRGASFASPLVAGLLAARLRRPDAAAAGRAVSALAASASDRGARGRDPVYGDGLVAADRRIAPAAVGARGALAR